MNLRAWLQTKTRSEWFLWQMSIGILIAGVVIAAIWVQVAPPIDDPVMRLINHTIDHFERIDKDQLPDVEEFREKLRADVAPIIDPWLAHCAEDIPGTVRKMEMLVPMIRVMDPGYDLLAAIEEKVTDPAKRILLLEYTRSLDARKPNEGLQAIAAREPAMRGANLALAIVFTMDDKWREAGAAYEREGAFPDAEPSRRAAIDAYTQAEAFDEVSRLRQDPAYADLRLIVTRYDEAVAKKDWLGVLRWVWIARYDNWISPQYIVLGVLSGIFWLLFLLHVSGVRSIREVRLWLCFAGVALGVLSMWPTLFIYDWLEHGLGFSLGYDPDLRQGLLFCIAGIGVNEETCKLLFVLPLVPTLVKRGHALEMLIVSACVGLGFAAEENIGHFESSSGAAAAGRFLTANFFHVAATGMTGFALCQLILKPAERAMDFAIVFLGVVVLHGLYDALLLTPALADYSYFYGAVFILLAMQFFQEMRRYMSFQQRTISLTAVFLGGFCTLIAAAYIIAAHEFGLVHAADLIVPSTLASLVIIVLYFREINEPLHP